MKLKKLGAILLSAALLISLAACAGNGDTGNDAGAEAANGGDEATEVAEPTGDQETLVIWSWGADEERVAREEMVDLYQELNPQLNIDHSVVPTADGVWDQRMTAALAAGTGPDVIQMSPDWYGLFSDHFVDLAPFLERYPELHDVVTDGLFDAYFRPDGMMEGMPLLTNTFALAFNKDMFDEFGVAHPTGDWTWNDLVEAAVQFAGGTGADATFGLASHWVQGQLSIVTQGGSPYSDDLSTLELNSPEVAAGLDLFGYLVQTGARPDNEAAQALPQEQQFVSQRAAMYLLGGFEASLVASLIGDSFAWDVVTLPRVPGGTNNVRFMTGYSLVNTTEQADLGWDFLRAVVENEDMGRITSRVGIPANRNVAETFYAEMTHGPISNDVFVAGLEHSRLWIFGGALSEVGSIWGQVWESVIILGMSGEDALNEYYPSLQRAFNDAMGN